MPESIQIPGRFNVRIEAEVPVGKEHVIVAWPSETEDRKRHAGSALLSAEGETRPLIAEWSIDPRIRW